MKAVIMAGGEGSRLRPLTCNIPKPMARLCGKPIMEYIFELLLRNEVTDASVTLGYLPDIICEKYPDGKYKQLNLKFITEEKPLGTAGSVKNAARDFTEPFLVISGDAMCDYNLDKVLKYHESIGAAATIVAATVEDPREYGLIKTDAENRVTGFIEKPAWGQATTDLANTGIYIINPDCLSLIPDDEKFDFAKDFFPIMLQRDMPLYCYHATGYWCDIGDINAYMRCQRDIFDGKVDCKVKSIAQGIYASTNIPRGDYNIIPPVFFGDQVEIGKGATVGPYTVIDNGCLIGDEAKVRSSVMLENSYAAKNTTLTGALMCSGSTLKRNASMYEGSVVGSGSIIGAGATVKPNVLIWPEKTVESYAVVSDNLKFGSCNKEIFDDNGIGGDGGIELTAETCAAIGSAIGSINSCKKAGVACDGSNKSKAMMLALMAGLMSAGSHVWSFGECFEAQLSFFTSFCGLGIGIFVSNGQTSEIKVCGEGGLTIPRFLEREIESRVSRGEFNRCSNENCKDIADMSSIKMMYNREMLKQAPYELGGMRAGVESSNERIRLLLHDCFKKLGCEEGSDIIFRVNRSGTRLSAVINDITLPYEKLLAICCYNEFRNGNDVALPFEAPQMLETLASGSGCRVYRYLSSPADSSDSLARRLSAKQLWVRDGLFMAVRLMSIVKEREKSLNELFAELPDFYIEKKTLMLQFPPSRLSEFLGEDSNTDSVKEGIVLKRERGRLLITPSKSGRHINVLAEANNMEAAVEMCNGLEKILDSYNKS